MSNSAILTFHGSASPGSPAAPAPRCSPRSSSPFSPISTARAAPASVSKDTSAQFLPLYLVRTLAAMMCPAGAKASHTEISSADECSMPPTQTVRAALPSSCAHAAGSALPSPPSRASKASTVPFPLPVRSGMAAELRLLALRTAAVGREPHVPPEHGAPSAQALLIWVAGKGYSTAIF